MDQLISIIWYQWRVPYSTRHGIRLDFEVYLKHLQYSCKVQSDGDTISRYLCTHSSDENYMFEGKSRYDFTGTVVVQVHPTSSSINYVLSTRTSIILYIFGKSIIAIIIIGKGRVVINTQLATMTVETLFVVCSKVWFWPATEQQYVYTACIRVCDPLEFHGK